MPAPAFFGRRSSEASSPPSSARGGRGATSRPTTAASLQPGADYAFSFALFAVALLPRLYASLAFAREPVWDGHYYHFGAERIAAGLGYSEDVVVDGITSAKPWTHYPVGYSGFLSIFYRIFGSSIVTAPVVGAVVGAALVLVVHRLARHMLSENRARIAGTLALIHPGLILYSAVVMNEQLTALLLLLACLCLVSRPKGWFGVVLSGPLLGLATLVRPTSLLSGATVALVEGRPFRRAALRTLGVCLLAILCVLPWTARNCRVMDGCALVSTNGGWNLAIGALTTTGRFETLRAEDGCPVVTGQVQQDRCWARVGAERILSDPLAWISKMPKKLAQTYDHESFAIEYLREAAPDQWPEGRRAAGRELLTFFHRLLMVLAALSPIALVTSERRLVSTISQSILLLMTASYAAFCFGNDLHPFFGLMFMMPLVAVLPFPGRPELGPVGRYLQALVFTTSLTHAVFFGDDRYHLVVSPALCILAAAALRKGHPGAGERAP